MGAWEFSWMTLPDALRQLLPSEYTADQDRFPDADLARVAWPHIRDDWLLPDQQRTMEFASLLDDLDVARTTRRQSSSDADFLRNLRNTSGLRQAIVRYLLQFASIPPQVSNLPDGADIHDGKDVSGQGIPSADFGPRNFTDFTRLANINELSWGYWLLGSSNAVEALLPGESIILAVEMDGPATNGDPTASIGFMFTRLRDEAFEVIAAPESVLPQGVTYSPLRGRISDLGWDWTPEGMPVREFVWPDGIDDGVVLVQQTLRTVFLIDGPARAYQSGEMRPPAGMLPAAPLPNEVVCPESPTELIMVIDSIIRAMGGHIIGDFDATTHGFRWGEWSGWIHADSQDAILDVVVIALDDTSGSGQSLDAEALIDLQTQVMRFGRVVISAGQMLIAASFPCQAFRGESFQTLLIGMVNDAAACLGQSRALPDTDRSIGGYL